MTVERGNLPNSERCGGSRLMAGDSMYTITPPRYENVWSGHLYWSRDNGRKVPYGLDYSVVVPNTRLFRL